MKQRITIEQLNELSDDQKERLRGWWEPEQYDVVRDLNHNATFDVYYKDGTLGDSYIDYDKNDCLPLLSIGQMMELLGDKGESYREVLNGDFDYIEGACDALFEAVKRIL